MMSVVSMLEATSKDLSSDIILDKVFESVHGLVRVRRVFGA